MPILQKYKIFSYVMTCYSCASRELSWPFDLQTNHLWWRAWSCVFSSMMEELILLARHPLLSLLSVHSFLSLSKSGSLSDSNTIQLFFTGCQTWANFAINNLAHLHHLFASCQHCWALNSSSEWKRRPCWLWTVSDAGICWCMGFFWGEFAVANGDSDV